MVTSTVTSAAAAAAAIVKLGYFLFSSFHIMRDSFSFLSWSNDLLMKNQTTFAIAINNNIFFLLCHGQVKKERKKESKKGKKERKKQRIYMLFTVNKI